MNPLRYYQSTIQSGALIDLAFIRHAPESPNHGPSQPAAIVQRERPELGLSLAEQAMVGGLLVELAGAVLDAIGVKSWPVDINANPFMAVEPESFRLPPWLRGRPWSDVTASAQPDADPELQRDLRSIHMVYGYTGGALDLWVSGLADVDLEGVGEAGAVLEIEALDAVDAWLRRRIAARTEADAVKLREAVEHWRTAARIQRGLPPEERLAGWVRSAGSAQRDSAPWVTRLCWVAGLVAVILTRKGPPAVVPAVFREVFDGRPKQGGLWLVDDAGQGRMQLGQTMVATVDAQAMRALKLTHAQEAGALWAELSTVPALRFMQHLIIEGQRQQARGEDPRVVIDGGHEGCRQQFGGKPEDWPKILKGGQHISLESSDGTQNWHGLWTYYTRRESTSTGQVSRLEVEPGRLFKRGEVHQWWPTGTGLVPVLAGDVPVHESLGRSYRIHAPVWRLHHAMMVHLVERWRDASGDNLDVYQLDKIYLERLAAEAGLKDPAVLWSQVIPGFIEGTDKAAAFIEAEVGRKSVEIRLADPHAAEREFIAQGVKVRLNASKAGQASGKKRFKR